MAQIGSVYKPVTDNVLDLRCVGDNGTPSTGNDGLTTTDRARGLLRVEFADDQNGATHKLYVWNGSAWVEHNSDTITDLEFKVEALPEIEAQLTDHESKLVGVTSASNTVDRVTTFHSQDLSGEHYVHVYGPVLATEVRADNITDLEFKVEALPEIEAQLTDHETRIIDNFIRVDTVEESVIELEGRCEDLEFKVEALPEIEAQLTDHEARIRTNEVGIAGNDMEIAALQDQTAGITGTTASYGGYYSTFVNTGDTSGAARIYFDQWPGYTNGITYCYARSGNGYVGVITGLWTTGAVYPSDDLLKFNEVALSSGLDAVKLLQPRRYMKVRALEDEQVPENACTEIGFVAQEVEQVPNLDVLVMDYPDGKDITKTVKAVSYNGITAVNTQALKELLAKVEALEARVAALEG